jgi:tetratricopeptide (TPR) repeat protein
MIRILIICFFVTSLFSNSTSVLNSQPNILFDYKNLKDSQDKLGMQLEFNKAVLLMEQKKYIEAIQSFEKSISILEIPSYLNIAIAYYGLERFDDAKKYFELIFNNPQNVYDESYAYMSASYYLYQLTNDDKYLEAIMATSKRANTLNEQTKALLVDTLILLKEYHQALVVLDSMEYEYDFKKALLYLKVQDFAQANLYLERTNNKTLNPELKQRILWLMVYHDLKTNSLEKLLEHLTTIEKDKERFKAHFELPLIISFNKQKYSNLTYLQRVTNFDETRVTDFLFYFAPFIFSDTQEIIFDTAKGFIYKSKQSLNRLDSMMEYNLALLENIKKDPVIRVNELSKLIKTNSKSYEFYNLGLAYAQIFDFHNAYKNFSRAYMLNPGNKMYAAMTLISAKRISLNIKEKKYIEANMLSGDGLYNYFGQMLYKLGANPNLQVKIMERDPAFGDTIFVKSLEFLQSMQEEKGIPKNSRLLKEHTKDPLVYLLSISLKKSEENDFQYFSRLQDKIPLKFNNNFLQGPLLITDFYMDMLKSVGMISFANFEIYGDKSPTYLRTQALKEIHIGDPKVALDILENLQVNYNMEDKFTLYLQVAAYLQAGMPNEAILTISLIKGLLKDNGADYLTGVLLINELKLSSINQYFKAPYEDALIDFELVGFDKFLEKQ